jgi:hypothetical protein
MYECHITYEFTDPRTELPLVRYAKKYDWKTSYITDDPALGPGKRFFLTTHDVDLKRIYDKMKQAVNWVELPKPVRHKIEHVIHDSKYNLFLDVKEPSAQLSGKLP